MKRNNLIFLAVAGFGLTACNTQPVKVVEPTPQPEVVQRLADAASGIERLQNELLAIEKTRLVKTEPASTVKKEPIESQLPDGHVLLKRVSTVYRGDVRTILSKLSVQSGLDFMIEGRAPTQLLINLNLTDQPLVRVFETIGVQIGHAADLVYTPSTNVLSLQYR